MSRPNSQEKVLGQVSDTTEMESLKGEVGSTLKRETESTQKSMPSVGDGFLKKRRLESKKEPEMGNAETQDIDTKKVLYDWRKMKNEKQREAAQLELETQDIDTKKVLYDWRKMKNEKQREAAQLELEQVKNTAGFEHNKEAMREFEILLSGSPKSDDINRQD